MIKEISSAQNPIIKDVLFSQTKKGAMQLGVCFIESEKVIRDCVANKLTIKQVFIESGKQNKFENLFNGVNVTIISSAISKKISETCSPSGIYALVELPKQTQFDFNRNFLVLDSLQDPSNLGAIIRSAVAFGYNQIICIDGVFPYLSKVIRASMGYVFKVNFLDVTASELTSLKQKYDFNLISANLNGKILNDFKPPKHFGLIIGNEGNGVSESIQNLSDFTVTIPMQNNVESLNASISASILMYNLNKE